MRFVKYLCAATVLFASCRASRNTIKLPDDMDRPTLVAAIQPLTDGESSTMRTAFSSEEIAAAPENELSESVKNEVSIISKHTEVKKKITSFTQMKEMAAKGEIAMSKKDLKTLTRLEKHYKGNYEQFRADTFEFTNAAKVVGGIGLLGLLLGIITGSAFGWFLFIVAALAFLLRYLNIIAF